MTTINLYSSRSRIWFAKLCADLFGAAEELIREDVGELINKVVCYLAATSRKLLNPISVLIQSGSSASKSTLQNAILSLMPDEEYEKYTRVTDQSFFYKEEDFLKHKIFAIEKDVGVSVGAIGLLLLQFDSGSHNIRRCFPRFSLIFAGFSKKRLESAVIKTIEFSPKC